MRIGVVTFWYGKENYGMLLQCWALQQMLKQMGHSPFVIRYEPKSQRSGILGKLINNYRFIKNFIKTSAQERSKIKRRGFDIFRENNLELSTNYYNNLSEIQKTPPIADCYIAGSDQIWAQLLSNKNNKVFFLDFGSQTTMRIAYAPSFSMKDYPLELKQQLREILKKFDAVSCREYDGVRICNSVGIKAVKVLDPTMLLKKENYLNFIEKKEKKRKQIFIYSINISEPNEIRWMELKNYANKRDLSILVTTANGYIRGEEIFKGVEYSYATIPEWLSNIFNSELVVTTSFHGIVFSIIFEKNFIYIPLKGVYEKGNNRVFELLNDLNLGNRILTDTISYDNIMQNTIDWSLVGSCLNNLRKTSLEFLQDSIDKDIHMKVG